MKTSLILFFLFLAPMAFAQDWVKVPLDEQASIYFPSQPRPGARNHIKEYILESEAYMVVAKVYDLRDNPMSVLPPADLDKFYEDHIQGAFRQMSAPKLLAKKMIQSGDFQGREHIYTMDFMGISRMKVTEQVFLVGEKMIGIEFSEPEDDDFEELKKKLFNSLEFN